jgi:hypothetical protein
VTRRLPSLAGWRDALLFLTGLGLIVYEATIHAGPERWGLLMVYAGMVGLPVFIRADQKAPTPPSPAPQEPDE